MKTLDDWLASFGSGHPSNVLRGLDRVHEAARRLDVVPPAPTTVVVAGTNGKGSTVAALEALLAPHARVGVTISPHLHRFTERVRIDRREATETELIEAFEAITDSRGDIPLSYFEYGILAAMYRHKVSHCDVSILEVGLGGRLDAVNIVDADLTVITSIGFDHQEYLGDTLELIGAEKAGVLRPGVPLVFGAPSPPESVIERAEALDAPIYLAGRDFGFTEGHYYVSAKNGQQHRIPLTRTAVAPTNVATALQSAMLLDPQAVSTWPNVAGTLENPGRFEVVERDGLTYVIDVAHNVDGARFLAAQVAERFGTVDAAIVGTLSDKDVAAIVRELDRVVSRFAFADTTGARGRSGEATAAAAGVSALATGCLNDVLNRVRASTSVGNGVILVLGSFDLVERMRDGLAA